MAKEKATGTGRIRRPAKEVAKDLVKKVPTEVLLAELNNRFADYERYKPLIDSIKETK